MYEVNYEPNPKQQKMLETIQELFPGSFVAGGAIRDGILGLEPRDYDVYHTCREDLEKAIKTCQNSTRFIIDSSKRSYLMSYKYILDGAAAIDVVFGTEGQPETILNGMDFTCCQVFWKDGRTFALSEDVLRDIQNRQLIPVRDVFPRIHSTRQRMLRFISRGWKISESDAFKVIMGRKTQND